MKLRLLFFTLSIIFSPIHGTDEKITIYDVKDTSVVGYPAIAIIYYPDALSYAFVDIKTIQKISFRKGFGPKYSHVLIYCANTYDTRRDPAQQLVLFTIKQRNEKIVVTNICLHHHIPMRFSNGDFGYHFRTEDVLTIRRYNLPPFPVTKTISNTPYFAIVRISTLRNKLQTIKTQYTFTSYKHFLGSSKIPNWRKTYKRNIMSYYEPNRQAEVLHNLRYRAGDTFVPHQLIPLKDFTDNISRQTISVDTNATPLWKSVSELMKKIEYYIRYIAQNVEVNTLSVMTLTHGGLELPYINDPNSKKMVFLDYEILLVQKIIVKILRYRVLVRKQKKVVKIHYYYIAIVVHNESFYENQIPEDEKLCQIDVCQDIAIVPRHYHRNIFYCCDLRDDKLEEIYAPYHEIYAPDYHFDLLSLKTIPIKEDEQGVVIEAVEIAPLY